MLLRKADQRFAWPCRGDASADADTVIRSARKSRPSTGAVRREYEVLASPGCPPSCAESGGRCSLVAPGDGRKPRCQDTAVSGFTSISDSAQPGHGKRSAIRNNRSSRRSLGWLCFRLNTASSASCCRSATLSAREYAGTQKGAHVCEHRQSGHNHQSMLTMKSQVGGDSELNA